MGGQARDPACWAGCLSPTGKMATGLLRLATAAGLGFSETPTSTKEAESLHVYASVNIVHTAGKNRAVAMAPHTQCVHSYQWTRSPLCDPQAPRDQGQDDCGAEMEPCGRQPAAAADDLTVHTLVQTVALWASIATSLRLCFADLPP